MSIRISLHRLAAAVAESGGIGTIGGMGLSPDELKSEIRQARLLTKGIVGVNLMYAGLYFTDLLDVCIKERTDFVAIGAGYARDPFRILSRAGIPGFCIISSVKAARIVARTEGITGVIVESGQAGGHLGPKNADISTWELFPQVQLDLYEQGFTGPVIAAGGLLDHQDVRRALKMGASGVQLGSRFALTEESEASDEMKSAWVAATGSQIVDWSPTGLVGRVIIPHSSDRLPQLGEPGIHCVDCLKVCSHRDQGKAHCIWNSLNNAQQGNVREGLVFCGGRVGEINDVVPVNEVFRRLVNPVAVEI
ncbi:MAG: nitronate monooxygenase [Firmicutes bacterium]|nr:nitronate monooxygenase [Bacillota bacterium]